MKNPLRYALPMAFGALVMQGCASRADIRDGALAAAASPPASPSSAVDAAAPAETDGGEVMTRADTLSRFEAVAAAVQKEMSAGGRFEFVSGLDRQTVYQRLADMKILFNQFGAVDKMDTESRVRLFNDQEKINGILTRNDSNRLICTRDIPVGTDFPKMVCRTYGDIRRLRQSNTNFLLRGNIQPPNVNLGGAPKGSEH